MKLFILSAFSLFCFSAFSQKTTVSLLPAGKYEAFLKQSQNKWSNGDIILMDENRYKVSSNVEVGEYRFSATAQRIFFVSGPLKTVFAKTSLNAEKPTITLPLAENEQQGLKLISADVIAYLRD